MISPFKCQVPGATGARREGTVVLTTPLYPILKVDSRPAATARACLRVASVAAAKYDLDLLVKCVECGASWYPTNEPGGTLLPHWNICPNRCNDLKGS